MEQLTAFRAVAATGSFTRAAEKLYRTQPAVSQAVRSLEEELDEIFFTREGRKNRLTQAGRIFLLHVEEVFETLEQGRLRLESLKGLKEGTLIISASDTTAYYLLPEILKEFRDMHPGIDVRIHSKPSPVSAELVAAREADLGIVTLPVDNPKLTEEPLIYRQDVAICSAGHELSGRKRIVFKDLARYPLILLDRGSNTRAYIDQRMTEAGLNPKIIMELGSIEVIKKMVQLEFGISIVPLISVQKDIEQGTLKAVRLFKKSECRRLGLVYCQKGIQSLAAQVFANLLREKLSQ